MFYIDEKTGRLFVNEPTLDRETHSFYTLTIKGTDLDGAVNGNSATGTVEITVLDINDNAPRLEKEQYEGSVDENTANVVVMRIKALDDDLENTDNWLADFNIVSGNEDGLFSIKTDPKTNEGILMLNKITVNNLPDGPTFSPEVKPVPLSEDPEKVTVPSVIVTYPAIDGDTGKVAENVRYAKGFDPDNWISIDEKTAEIKLTKMPDRESKHLVNGTYYAKILCMTQDMPSRTATGTIALQIEDSNDHCPQLTSTHQSICTDAKEVHVTAVDEDVHPNGAPFEFLIVQEGTKGDWDLEHLNDTTAILRARETLWPGSFEVMLEIKDKQGVACPDKQVLQLEACTCVENGACVLRLQQEPSAEFGGLGIGLLALGFVMLLLPLKESTLGGAFYETLDSRLEEADFGLQREAYGSLQREAYGSLRRDEYKSAFYSEFVEDDGGPYGGIALPEAYLEEYYSQKARCTAEHTKDSLLVFDYEGEGSPAGSVGCCSLLGTDNDLGFLNDLGPKFKTLASICKRSETEPEASIPLPKPKVEYKVASNQAEIKKTWVQAR
ncbi:hypothetical protein MATL_G00034280 [Megalops atlanticus]|uniref:Cadherin domain-containing protein n=1 Tax=Megalops atlanticus TaxID=7932 RepID=A0A9D3QHK2_MEGAT|nr:hypothetical protein MATL_G00034280 [Megalops atlanticus]